MPADILTLHSVPPPQARTSPVPMAQEEELAALEFLHQELLCRGLPDNEARTEVARIAARKVWDGFAAQLRRHRAAGRQVDANVLAVALGSMQGMTFPLLRHRGDVDFASRAIGTARRRLRHNGGLLHRLHPHGNPAFDEADATFQSLEVFLARPRPRAA